MRTIRHCFTTTGLLAIAWTAAALPVARAAENQAAPAAADDSLMIQEIVVTARKRTESLQRVPDAITAFTAESIVTADIKQLSDFAALTPNMTFHGGDAYRAGQFSLSMRGIGNGQEGWSSVSYIVDGVAASSTDSINSGSLEDIERIEVLRGPQSALYGFNALAGAINVITKRPTNDWEFSARALYGKGPDRQVGALVSGPIVQDKLLFRLSGSYRDDEGLIKSGSNGRSLSFKDRKQAQARLIFKPVDNLEFDLLGTVTRQQDGAGYLDKVPSEAFIDNFDPAYNARRAFPGSDDRKVHKLAARIQWDFAPVSLISVTGFDDIDQHLNLSTCYDDPNDPVAPFPGGGGVCLFGPAFGEAAPPGAPIDFFYDGLDNFQTFTQDVRIASRNSESVEWTVGASILNRKYITGFDAQALLAPDIIVPLFPSWNDKRDDWWGVYGQLIWKATEKLELTAAARYDDETYENTSYSTRDFTTIVPVLSPDGVLENTQKRSASAFQPKGQASYRFTDDVMGYATVSRGFRAGYFITGNYTLPEETTNYEVGLKTSWLDRRIVANFAAFHIDYSDQQFQSLTPTFPFRATITIPDTKINGIEYESTLRVSRFVSFGLALGFLDAKVSNDGGRSPNTPRFNGSASADFTYPVSRDWKANLHIDDRYNSEQFLDVNDQQRVPAKNFVNLRAGVQNDRYEIAAFMRNATDERQATIKGIGIPDFGFIRYQNEPRSYGVEVRASF